MKAIRVHQFGPPDVLKLEEVDVPQPGPGQVVVSIRAAGVNPVETYIRSGKYGARTMPFTPGKDAGGTVEALGAGVTEFRAGDRVYTSDTITGAYAELALCDLASVHRLPERCSFAQGASIGIPAATAYYGLFYRAAARAGETVLVHGATGGVGTAAVQLARAAGMTVLATAGDEEGRRYVIEQGAHHTFGHDVCDAPERLKQLTGGRGIDVVLEMLADKNLNNDLGVLARRGRVIVIGSRGTVEIDPRLTMQWDSEIRGLVLTNASPEEQRGIYAALTAALEANTLRPVIAMELALADAPRAHEEVMRNGKRGKIVLLPG